ncbi:glutamyl-tRNA synthetase [Nematocida displodere]|uniref:Probable glutamate--tRNA ligase, cytoplasmic n=1 Tax=Nematocida displodere TaxID=1805483 RepID=A0A177ECI2_9MICR|nr:glutamyl-tRNA synthetase [Nematocida displodere]
MVKVSCDYSKRHHIVAYFVSKCFPGVEIEQTGEKHKDGFCNYLNLPSFLDAVPVLGWKESMPFLAEWKVGMPYKEILALLPAIEEAVPSLSEREQMLLFFLLFSETIFVNLAKAKKLKDFPHISALYAATAANPKTEQVMQDYEKAKKLETKATDQASFDIGLPDNYKVVTRFPPEPSGYLHIGHAKAALLNQYFAETYHGQMIVRMDDTNPTNEKEEFEKTILEDLALLGITNYTLTRTSDHFGRLYQLAESLIQKGLAYCDNTPVEEMRYNREHGIATAHRDASVEDNQRIFKGLATTEEYDSYCLRAKISVDNANKAMRDPVIYRVNKTPHHYTGTTHRIYPTYDFACPVVDSIEGVTLALRTNEYRDRNPQYMWFISALDLTNRPMIWDFSRLNFKRTLLSKRKLRWFVDNGQVSGWDDPRMPTVRGILRKGLSKDALRAYIISQGPSRNTVLLSWDKLWSDNAHHIDGLSKRYHGIDAGDALTLKIEGGSTQQIKVQGKEEHRTLTPEVFVSKADAASLKAGEEITLMGVGSFKVLSLPENGPGTISQTATPPKNTKLKLTWAPSTGNVKARVFEYTDLITVDKPEDQELKDIVNHESKEEREVLCDERALQIKEGDFIQIEKRGFFFCDSLSPLTLNLVPGTKQNRQ